MANMPPKPKILTTSDDRMNALLDPGDVLPQQLVQDPALGVGQDMAQGEQAVPEAPDQSPLVGPGEEFAQGVRLPGRHLPDLPLGGDPAQDGGAAPIVGGEEEGFLLLRDRGADPDRPDREGAGARGTLRRGLFWGRDFFRNRGFSRTRGFFRDGGDPGEAPASLGEGGREAREERRDPVVRGQLGLREPDGPDQQLVDPRAVPELGDVAGGSRSS